MLAVLFAKVKLLNKGLAFSFIFVLSVFVVGCGKRKPPLPPLEKVSQRAAVNGFQRGGAIHLTWEIGPRNPAQTDILNISRVDVYRLAEPAAAPRGVSEEEFASRSTIIAAIKVSPDDFRLRRMTYIDALDFAQRPSRLRYAVRFVNSAGQKAAFSDFFVVEPTSRLATPPSTPTLAVTQEAIALRWRRPERNIDGSTPANILGYNVYRAAGGVSKLLNQAPVGSEEFADKSFAFGATYEYVVRTVSLGANGEPIESNDSEIVNAAPKDVFAPAAPTALTIAAAPTAISVFFASNLESDVAGYIVYRSTNRDLPLDRWSRMTPSPIKTNTFIDQSVEAGKTYFYYVTAIDTTGNTSAESEIVGDKVP